MTMPRGCHKCRQPAVPMSCHCTAVPIGQVREQSGTVGQGSGRPSDRYSPNRYIEIKQIPFSWTSSLQTHPGESYLESSFMSSYCLFLQHKLTHHQPNPASALVSNTNERVNASMRLSRAPLRKEGGQAPVAVATTAKKKTKKNQRNRYHEP